MRALRCAVVVALTLPGLVAAQVPGPAPVLRDMGRFDACAVEALRVAVQAGPDRAPALDLAATCLAEAGRPEATLRLLDHHDFVALVQGSPRLRARRCLAIAVAAPHVPVPADCVTPPPAPDATTLAADATALAADASARAATAPLHRALLLGNWSAAQGYLAAAALHPATEAWHRQAASWLRTAEALPAPSPALAAALSALVPGLGRVYLGRWQDGVATLGLVVAPGYFAWDGFADQGVRSTRGWLLGTVAAVMYAGNVYGSWVGARQVHRVAEENLRQEVQRELARRPAF